MSDRWSNVTFFLFVGAVAVVLILGLFVMWSEYRQWVDSLPKSSKVVTDEPASMDRDGGRSRSGLGVGAVLKVGGTRCDGVA